MKKKKDIKKKKKNNKKSNTLNNICLIIIILFFLGIVTVSGFFCYIYMSFLLSFLNTDISDHV